MNNNWQQIKEIFAGALREKVENRSHFITDQCAGDKNLEREVESLLASYSDADLFLENPAVSEVAEDFASKPKTLQNGDFIKHYQILKRIGKGGMGEVYLAQDSRLGRKVAIKILSNYFGDNRENLKRFIREAKAASSLNHPNIVIIHEIDESEGRNYIVSEFIEGLTLSEVIQRKDLSLTQISDISIQVVKALSAAHAVGIVHRDVKPDNVMVRDDGIVKVLDFGLAKLVEKNNLEFDPNGKTLETLNTRSGMILGTVSYMSPEQTRGKDIDKRTDIWSFGVLLYQVLTKRFPFEGETTSDLIAAILKSEPLPVTQIAPNIPKELEQIIAKTLQKNPNERFQTAVELLDSLKAFQGKLKNGQKTEPLNFRVSDQIGTDRETDFDLTKVTARDAENVDSSKKYSFISQTFSYVQNRPTIPLIAFLSCVLMVVIGYFGWSKFNYPKQEPNSFQTMRLSKLTYEGRASNLVTISPDGKYIAYVLKNEGKEALMVRQVTTAGVAEIIPPADVHYSGIFFSPDNNSIYYTTSRNDAVSELSEIPVLGGNPRKLLNNLGEVIAFSPDNKIMAYVTSRNSIMISDIKGESPRLLANSSSGETIHRLVWKPDGKSIISSVFSTDERFYLSEFSIVDGTEKRLPTPPWVRINGLRFLSDGSGLIIAGRDLDTQFSQIWFVSYPNGEVKRITNDLSTYMDLSLTADNKSLVTIKEERLYNIWSLPNGKTESAKKVTLEEGRDEGIAGLAQTSDGKIVYTVRKAGIFDLWIVNADGSENRQLTFNQGSNYLPMVSPDSKSIIFSSDRLGNFDIWQMNIDGTNPTALKNDPKIKEAYPTSTPDGKWIVYQRTDTNNHSTIWKMNLETAESIQLTDVESFKPTVSPDGKFIACEYSVNKNEPEKIAIIPIDGGKPVKILDLPLLIKSSAFRWSADSKSLIYIDKKDRVDNLWSQTLDNNPPKQLTFFESGQIWKFELSNNGQGFILSRGNESSDVLMISDFK